MTLILLIVGAGALFLAFSNGANDNFKGFATVWGSHSLSYRRALIYATIATAAGSLASLFLANGLIGQFSGKGLIPDAALAGPTFIAAVALGAAATVIAATRIGMPISTTHALLGGLLGAGLMSSEQGINWSALGSTFVLPLLLSPLVAALLGMIAYRLLKRRSKIDCICVAEPKPELIGVGAVATRAMHAPAELVIGATSDCRKDDSIRMQVSVPQLMDRVHVLSAATICFARGVNDTPKLAALFIAARISGAEQSVGLIALMMVAGGLLLSRRVAETMSLRINHMHNAQGVSANLITALLVLFASRLGLPVSTTHVAVGSIAGVGASAGTIGWGALRAVLLSWLATLPLAAALAWAFAALLQWSLG